MFKTLCHLELWCKRKYLCIFTNYKLKKAVIRQNFNMPKPGYYAVRVGKIPGIYTSWTDCEIQVKGFPNAVFKKFPSVDLAKNFLNEGSQKPQIINETKNNDSSFHNEFDFLNESNFWSDCTFDDVVPIINTVSDLTTIAPEISYSKSFKNNYYAVHRGKKPGVYRTWTDCSFQIKDFSNASYRKFDNEKDALEYVRTGGIQKASKRELQTLEINNEVKKIKLDSDNNYKYVLENPNDTVVVFTDGASSENGKKRSRAGIGVYWGDNHPLNASKRIIGRQTNNRAEIYAAVHALNQAKQIGAKNVRLYTDSQFIIHAITDWIKKWKANGWKLVTGKEVVNKEDFIALSCAEEGLNVEWVYVKAHARNQGNDEADRLAVAGSKLILQPENCSEFQNFHIDVNLEKSTESFLVTHTQENVKHLIIPDFKEKKSYYAVYRGNNPGVYSTWTECEQQIKNYFKPSFRKFDSEEEAKEFAKTGKIMQQKLPVINHDEFVTVFTDGASSSNGKDDATAGIGVYWGPGNMLNTSMRLPGRQTNNRAEIFAAVHALRQAKQLGIKNIRLYTDSQFVIKGITTWIKKWKKNNWKLANGKPVVNKEDFIALDDAAKELNIDWCYVKGHDNNPGNVEADQLAVAGCRKSLADTFILT